MATFTSTFMLSLVISILTEPGLTEKPAFSGIFQQADETLITTERLLQENKFIKSKMEIQDGVIQEIKSKMEIQDRNMQEMEIRYTNIINNMQAKLVAGYKVNFQNQETKYKTMETEYKNIVNVQNKKFKDMEAKYKSALADINSKLESHEATIKELQNSYLHVNRNVDFNENDLNSEGNKPNAVQMELDTPDVNHHLELNQSVAETQKGQKFYAIQKRLLQTTMYNIAFSAGLRNTLSHLAVGHTIVFDHVILNEGNGYNGSDGIFVTTISGLYLISFTLHCTGGGVIGGFELKVQGIAKGKVYCHSEGASTECLPVRLNKGDHVWIDATHPDTQIYGGSYYSMFSGLLISE